MRKKLICWLIGHTDDCVHVWVTKCYRCGFEWKEGDLVRSDFNFFYRWYQFKCAVGLRWLEQYRKCPTCGNRFGRHREDCFPF